MALLGNLVSAVAGRALARTVGGAAAGPAGAAIGMALPMVARRLGPLGMAGMAVGGVSAWLSGLVPLHRLRYFDMKHVDHPVPASRAD